MALVLITLQLSGCSTGDGVAAENDGGAPPQPPGANRAPSISGQPSSSAIVNTAYSFTPTATDPDGDSLTFMINNQPAWASFDSSDGSLSGTPMSPGMHDDIALRVSDGWSEAAVTGYSARQTIKS